MTIRNNSLALFRLIWGSYIFTYWWVQVHLKVTERFNKLKVLTEGKVGASL